MTISMVVKPVFQDLQFVLDLSATSFKAKSKLKKEIAVFGGYISYILTNKVRHYECIDWTKCYMQKSFS